MQNLINPHITIERRGTALLPTRDIYDSAGVLNPACTRNREGKLLLYPRIVEEGNISRIGIYELDTQGIFRRKGIALEAKEPYELRNIGDGQGCEDARVTFIPVLDKYVMGYTAFGPLGPRIAIAVSSDAHTWNRLGLLNFSNTAFDGCHDKDVAFFPEPVMSPDGEESLALYHRPAYHSHGALCEDIRIAYVPLTPVLHEISQILQVKSTVCVLEAGGAWGKVKVGAGTPPVRTAFGWLSLYHGVDRHAGETFSDIGLIYQAGVIIHDIQTPHVVKYVSPEPILGPETELECSGMVDNVVFPTAIDVNEQHPGSAMIYYGMADSSIGAALFHIQAESGALATA